MTKMTDEEVSKALQVMRGNGLAPVATLLESHIAALTAERDAVSRLAVERGAELDALRERVKALEASRRDAADDGDYWRRKAGEHERAARDAESRLAAIRQRATAIEHVIGKDNVAFLLKGDVAAEDFAHDAPAPSETPACESCGEDEAPRTTSSVGTYCVTCAAMPGNGGPSPCPDPSEMDGLRGEMAEAPHADCPDNPCPAVFPYCEDLARKDTPAEPTVPEAFARVQVGLTAGVDVVDREHARDALTLLERRMGAQEAALRAFLSDHGHTPDCGYSGYTTHRCSDECAGARAALTDAPPVFTLEEVDESMSKAGVSADERMEIRAHLKSLRR